MTKKIAFRWRGMATLFLLIVFMADAASGVTLNASPSCSPQDATPEPPAELVYKILSPTIESTVKTSAMAPRLDTLTGKTVCMVWNNAFQADVTFPAIGEELKKQYPDVKIVPYTDMPDAFLPEPPGTLRKESEALQAVFKEKGCNAVISGNGG